MNEELSTRYNSSPPPRPVVPAPSDDMLQPGDILGGCAIESFIARGGMGSVYRATKLSLRSVVALKVLRPNLLADPKVLSRFLREARVAASLSHPGIVRVYDVGQDRGLYYIVLEFVEGKDLQKIIKAHGPLKPKDALRVTRQVAEALAYAHSRGVVHRDVKPGNILIAKDGSVKLTDLGLARPATDDTEVTLPGEVLGTPAFMSPEQCRGEVLDGRSDLYSLGAALYAAISGTPPFKAGNTASLLHKVVHEQPPSLAARMPCLSEHIVTLIKRLMAKHPAARYQSGKEVVEAIQAIETAGPRDDGAGGKERGETVVVEAGSSPQRWAAICALGIILGVGIYFLAQHSSTEAGSRSRLEPAQGARDAARLNVFFQTSSAGGASPHSDREDGNRAGDDTSFQAAGGGHVAFLAPRGTVLDEGLKARVEGFRDALLAEDSDRILGYFPADIRDNATLHASLLGFLEKIRALEPTSAQYMSSRKGDDEASITLVFRGTDSGQSLGLPLLWVRTEGEWNVSPKMAETPPEE